MALPILVTGAALCCVAFSFCRLFSTFIPHDDEGKMLLWTQHLLDGHILYDQVPCPYGPFYFLCRWPLFAALGVPLTNDATRALTLLLWWLTAALLAAAVWRLAAKTGWATGLAVLVGVLEIIYLRVLPREPGHPQELVVLLLAAALWIAAQMWETRRHTALFLLGGIGGGLLLTKINVGVFYAAALGISVLALAPRSLVWSILRVAYTLPVLALPYVLLKSRLDEGFTDFALLITASLTPCCLMVLWKKGPPTIGFVDLLVCLGGVLVISAVSVGFALWHGSTLGGLKDSLILGPAHYFGGTRYGWPLLMPSPTVAWSVGCAILGCLAIRQKIVPRRMLSALRCFYVGVVLTGVLTGTAFDGFWICWTLPLTWLLLDPPPSSGEDASASIVRAFLAFSICLQLLQVFPMPADQVHYGSLLIIPGAAVLLIDLYQEWAMASEWSPASPQLVQSATLIAILAPPFILTKLRSYHLGGFSCTLPSLTSLWSLAATATGLALLYRPDRFRPLVWPLRLLMAGWIVWHILSASVGQTAWIGELLPLIWLLLIPPSGVQPTRGEWLLRFSLVAATFVETLGVGIVIAADDSQFQFGTVLMLPVALLLLRDVYGQFASPSRRSWTWTLEGNVVLAGLALACGARVALNSARTYAALDRVDLRGSHWTRMSERDASFYKFVAANIRASSDCFVPHFGLASAYFWADQRPVSTLLIGNTWGGTDPVSDAKLLADYRDRPEMMFVDNRNPWFPDDPRLKFLDFVADRFQTLARLGSTRLLVRKERWDFKLVDCAFLPKATVGKPVGSVLYLRLPDVPRLSQVARIDLANLEPPEELASTDASLQERKLVLKDQSGRTLLPSPNGAADLPAPGRDLRLSVPPSVRLDQVGYPVLRFFDGNGRRLLTLPVAVEAAVQAP
ncbi:MAG TPA: hypothetical protein VGP63_14915 [Planctomycetaceae bacterium]|jgi:hypothetical protein|nr:hypothetical protein [Planctomycetaceae bacterium]